MLVAEHVGIYRVAGVQVRVSPVDPGGISLPRVGTVAAALTRNGVDPRQYRQRGYSRQNAACERTVPASWKVLAPGTSELLLWFFGHCRLAIAVADVELHAQDVYRRSIAVPRGRRTLIARSAAQRGRIHPGGIIPVKQVSRSMPDVMLADSR